MKIACLAIMDNGNTMRHIARGLRDYCNVDAVCYTGTPDTYLHIPDATVKPWPKQLDPDDYDFIITNDHTYFQYHQQLRDKPRLVKCNGTWARKMGPWLQWDHHKHGTTYVTSPLDYTLADAVGASIQTLPPLIDTRLLPTPCFPDDKIVIGHATGGTHKGTKQVLEHLKPYQKRTDIEIDVIHNTPWTDAMQRKARMHIFIGQISEWRALGVNSIESLALGSIVLANALHPYILQHFDWEPIHEFPSHLKCDIEWVKNWHTAGQDDIIRDRIEWATQHFDISTQAPKWLQWIHWILEQEATK